MVVFSIDSLLKISEGGFRFVKQTLTSKKDASLWFSPDQSTKSTKSLASKRLWVSCVIGLS